jgi:uncharacterized protein YraI
MTASTCLRLSVGALLLTVSGALMAQNAETSDNASVRAGPDPSYPEVAELDADTPIQVMGCLDDWSWCDVTFGDNRGWLYSPDITYAYQGGYVPLYSYAPGLGIPVVGFSLDVYWGSHYHNRPWYGQREEWAHRTIHHQRPSGPPPSAGPPPREAVRMDRPHAGPQSDRSIRLGGAAEQSHQDAERPGRAAERPDRPADRPDRNAGRVDTRASQPRPQEHAPPPAQHPETNSKPPEHQAPQRDEGHMRPAPGAAPSGRAEPQRHEEPAHPAAPRKQEGEPPKQ